MVKVMVSIPDDLLQDIDRTAEMQGKSRSRFLQDAARETLAAEDAARRRQAFAAIRALAQEGPPLGDVAALIRGERDRALP